MDGRNYTFLSANVFLEFDIVDRFLAKRINDRGKAVNRDGQSGAPLGICGKFIKHIVSDQK